MASFITYCCVAGQRTPQFTGVNTEESATRESWWLRGILHAPAQMLRTSDHPRDHRYLDARDLWYLLSQGKMKLKHYHLLGMWGIQALVTYFIAIILSNPYSSPCSFCYCFYFIRNNWGTEKCRDFLKQCSEQAGRSRFNICTINHMLSSLPASWSWL